MKLIEAILQAWNTDYGEDLAKEYEGFFLNLKRMERNMSFVDWKPISENPPIQDTYLVITIDGVAQSYWSGHFSKLVSHWAFKPDLP